MAEQAEGEGRVPHEPTAQAADEDWRLIGQEEYLSGAVWVHKRYTVYSETWLHDHCDFCTAKFMDAEYSPEHREFIDAHPEVLTEGYATTLEHPAGADLLLGVRQVLCRLR